MQFERLPVGSILDVIEGQRKIAKFRLAFERALQEQLDLVVPEAGRTDFMLDQDQSAMPWTSPRSMASATCAVVV